MKLEKYINKSQEYGCDLTRELDALSNISNQHYYDVFYHYILADDWCKNKHCLAIRVHGGTVGGVYIDDNYIITKIVIDTKYIVKTYPANVNELIQKFVGEVIEW